MKMKKITFQGWKNCIELTNGDFRIVVTTEIGPRIVGAFLGKGANLLYLDKITVTKRIIPNGIYRTVDGHGREVFLTMERMVPDYTYRTVDGHGRYRVASFIVEQVWSESDRPFVDHQREGDATYPFRQ